MKKLIIILCFLPLFSYSGNIYKALADTVFIGSIPYKTATGELIIFNSTKDTAGVLYNNGSGVTQFKKVRSIKLNDSTYVIKIGTSVIGDTIKILSSASSVVLPVYVQVDSATVTSYDVLNSQNAPPLSPNVGDVYLVGNTPSGAWVGHAKDIAEWNGSAWIFTDGVQGDFLYNATNALTYIFRSGNWVQTTGIPALHNGNTISSGLKIGTRNNKDFNFISNNILRGGMLANGSFRVANQGGSGNVLVGADSLGVQRKLYIGDGLSLSNDSLLASGGGGSSAIFPNGGKIIEDTTYEITHSDAGYLLYFPYETTVTHSIANPLIESDVIGVQFYDPNSIITMDATLVELYLYSQLQSGDAEKGEVAIFQAIQDGEILPLFGLKTDESDGGKLKTITRYLYDNSGGGSISGLTAATATNSINNLNYKQRWFANTIGADTAFVLGTSSTAAASNLQTVLSVNQSGANATSTQSTYGIKISNKKTGTASTNIGIDLDVSGGGTNNAINVTSGRVLLNGNSLVFGPASNMLEFTGALNINANLVQVSPNAGTGQIHSMTCGGYTQFAWGMNASYNAPYFSMGGAIWNGGSNYHAASTNAILFRDLAGDLSISQDTSLSYGGTFTPTERIRFKANGTVGIGTSSPSSNAKLEITSTTKMPLKLTPMTATQASALTAEDGGLIYVSDTNGTFTSIGFWGRENGVWVKL